MKTDEATRERRAIFIRLSNVEYAKVVQVAREHGLRPSAFAKAVLRVAAQSVPVVPVPKPIAPRHPPDAT